MHRVRWYLELHGRREPHRRGYANGRGAADGEGPDGLRDLRDGAQVALEVLPGEEPLVHDAQGAVGGPLDGRYDG